MSKDLDDELLALFKSDDGDLFKPKPKASAPTPDDRLTESFKKITEFVEQNDRMPEIDSKDINEALLARRLEAIRSNREKVEALESVDSLGLLEMPAAPKSIDELFDKDELGLFSNPENDILNVRNVPARTQSEAVSVSRRKPAKDFHKFKPGFIEKQKGLKNGKYRLIRFQSSAQLKEDQYYISLGQMVYVDDIKEKKLIHGTPKARLRCLFENGTESAMYDRSLANDLYEDGYIVVDAKYIDEDNILTEKDEVKGYIYILSSKSSDSQIATIKDLYKIGFSTTPVAERIKHAENDPTYLMADVEIVDTYTLTGDYNPQKAEHFIHRIFSDAALDVSITDKNGRDYTPQEWYSVPVEAIRHAIQLIDSGEITNYIYDKHSQRMVEVVENEQ